jgi:hypothetical protein
MSSEGFAGGRLSMQKTCQGRRECDDRTMQRDMLEDLQGSIMAEVYLTVPFDLCAVVEEGGVKSA